MRIKKTAILVPLLFTPGQTNVQDFSIEIHHGTVILWDAIPDAVTIVTDSRGYSASTGVESQTCKIIELSSDMIFFYTGNLADATDTRTGKVIFSQYEVAQNAYDGVGKQPPSLQRLKDVATEWSRLVAPGMDRLLENDAEARTRIGLAGFASLDENYCPKLILVNIPISVPNDGSPASTGNPTISEWPPSPEQTLGTGWYAANQLAVEFLGATTDRAKKAVTAFENRAAKLHQSDRYAHKLIAAVEAALEWGKEDPTIGPPVDAIVIETGSGIRWIKHKPNSKCSNVAPK